ncbi:hypothetical protein BJ138DRAFT_1147706 [Hygrophoropsis aurantiaca]|uniref:Uncharacterized protein n=1 Tax=Hygrophoropsis aurantiaca TaxID=72124 RepID=A0ACB8AHA9_9AGAM|nr:hypothetical protein BJ138DRAFT_1147706 [Hygrophoropsis aurantiaca]
MPKQKKTGPPYTDRGAEYVVVAKPWGMDPASKNRAQPDVNRIGTWIHVVLRDQAINVIPETVYMMGTRDEVIVQLPMGTDIRPLLGQHRWSTFSHRHASHPGASFVFEYNYRNNGNPENHNWAEHYPQILEGAPVKLPYPKPSWIEPPNFIRSLVLPIPRHLFETETTTNSTPAQDIVSPALLPPSPPPQVEDQSHPTDPVSLFVPYHRPAQLPDNSSTTIDTSETSEDLIPTIQVEAEEPIPKFISKLDPHEQEEEAELFLRSAKVEVKEETDLLATVKQEVKSEPLDLQTSVQQEISTSSIEQELQEEYSRYMQMQGLAAPSSQPPSIQSNQRSGKVKREISDADIGGTMGVKKIKLETY